MPAELTPSARRLVEELEEDGATLPADPALRDLVVAELDFTRRIPAFEGRRPLYGSFVAPDDGPITSFGQPAEVVEVADVPLDGARRFADGRAAFLLRRPTRPPALAFFAHNLQYEADLVEVQAETGAHVVQRTPMLGAVRLFTDGAVVSWHGSGWSSRPTADAVVDAARHRLGDADPDVVVALVELAVHWLSSAHIGATLVLRPRDGGPGGFDKATALALPGLRVTDRRHRGSLVGALSQTDLATLVDPDGHVRYVGVGLLTTEAAEAAVDAQHGMRHRSAQRYSFDQPGAVVVVVSEDGPVTLYRGGEVVASTVPD